MSHASTRTDERTDGSRWRNRIVDHGEEAPDQLLAHPGNWRTHPQHQRAALRDVLNAVGWVADVIVNRTTGHMVDGHLRVALAMEAGQASIPVKYVDLSEDEERTILATLDPIGAMASADKEKLAELLAGIENPDLAALLDAVAHANRIALDLGTVGTGDPDALPEPPAEPRSKPGDLWLCGDHRLLCGDATDPEAVQRLMDGQRAAGMFTDPPYTVEYTGGNHPPSWAKNGRVISATEKTKDWSDDYIDHDHAVEFYTAFLRPALDYALLDDAAIYECYAMMRSEVVWQSWRAAGLLPHQVIIWQKSRAVLTHAWYLWDYEPLMVGWREGHQPKRRPPADAHAVWEIASTIEDGVSGVHPTQKPVELIRRPILYHTAPGELIYEPFSGSGTAIIAAEITGRRCYALELSPAFVDVAVARWERFTGRQAEHEKAIEGGPRG